MYRFSGSLLPGTALSSQPDVKNTITIESLRCPPRRRRRGLRRPSQSAATAAATVTNPHAEHADGLCRTRFGPTSYAGQHPRRTTRDLFHRISPVIRRRPGRCRRHRGTTTSDLHGRVGTWDHGCSLIGRSGRPARGRRQLNLINSSANGERSWWEPGRRARSICSNAATTDARRSATTNQDLPSYCDASTAPIQRKLCRRPTS